MALRRKNSRRITVDGRVYLWRVPKRHSRHAWGGTTGELTAYVQPADCVGSVLAVHAGHKYPAVAQLWDEPVVSVLPSHIASAIRRGLAAGWNPDRPGPGLSVDMPTDEA